MWLTLIRGRIMAPKCLFLQQKSSSRKQRGLVLWLLPACSLYLAIRPAEIYQTTRRYIPLWEPLECYCFRDELRNRGLALFSMLSTGSFALLNFSVNFVTCEIYSSLIVSVFLSQSKGCMPQPSSWGTFPFIPVFSLVHWREIMLNEQGKGERWSSPCA
jgi:hypothetical protein